MVPCCFSMEVLFEKCILAAEETTMNGKELTEPAAISRYRRGAGAPQRKTKPAPLDEEMVTKEFTE